MSETPTNVTPPPDLAYGYVDGRILLAIGDRSDAGRMPDPVPADGMTVTLTPANTILKVASPTPATVIKQPIVCAVDANGYLIDGQAARGVWLVTGTYKVTYSHWRAIIPSHDIEVTTGHTEAAPLDLTTAMPPGGPVLTPSEYAELNGRLTILEAGGGGGGVTDHGALTGLGEDDHPIYLTTGRGDARYVQGTDPRLSDARTPTAHTHGIADLTATGTPSATTYLRGDGTWATPAGGGGGSGPLTGTGFPEGVVAAPVGTEYVDTAATNGAIKWIKATGTGTTGWRVAFGDTGWRNITALFPAGEGITGLAVFLRLTDSDVILRFTGTTSGSAAFLSGCPAPGPLRDYGWSDDRAPATSHRAGLWRAYNYVGLFYDWYGAITVPAPPASGSPIEGSASWLKPDALLWPTTLPGTPA